MQANRKPLAAMGSRLQPGSQFSASVRLTSATLYHKGCPAVSLRYRSGYPADGKILEVVFLNGQGVRVTHPVTPESPGVDSSLSGNRVFHWPVHQIAVCGFSKETYHNWTGVHMRALTASEVNCPGCNEWLEQKSKTA